MKPIIKFNNGRGAILCHRCRTIIKEDLTEDEMHGKTDLFYCKKCLSLIDNEKLPNFKK